MRWTEDQYAAFLKASKQPTAAKSKVLITDGYRSNVAGWRQFGGKRYYMRSLYEINYGYYLEWLMHNSKIVDWFYEPQTFPFPKEAYRTGPFYYKPDFKVVGSHATYKWVEVKGWMNASSKKKISRFNKHYGATQGPIEVVDGEWFKAAFKQGLNKIIPGWESLPK